MTEGQGRGSAGNAAAFRKLAFTLGERAHALAAHPWRTLREALEFRLFSWLAGAPLPFPESRRAKFRRQAGRRDPRRFLLPEDPVQAPEDQTAPQRFVAHDPTLQPPETDVRLIAFYLPQFHPFAENDAWWGKGFTEWTNVGKALPLFEGHYQPHCPIHFGYYDLRVPEVMEEQASVARQYGIAGFAYHFYWFGGRTLMERPLRQMLANPRVEMPFCLCWANENWTRRWDGRDDQLLIGQNHSLQDSRAMLHHVADYLRDPRYIRIGGRPVFILYRPDLIPDIKATVAMWRDEARALGLGDLYLMAVQRQPDQGFADIGLDAAIEFPPAGQRSANLALAYGMDPRASGAIVFDYEDAVAQRLAEPPSAFRRHRGVTLSWDNTARRPQAPMLFVNFTIRAYHRWLAELVRRLRLAKDVPADEKLVFINAWNEWAEGTHLEPDQRHGFAYLDATRRALLDEPPP